MAGLGVISVSMNMDVSKPPVKEPAPERGIGILLKYDDRPPRSKRNEQFMNSWGGPPRPGLRTTMIVHFHEMDRQGSTSG